jgi:hypothetical protein
MMIMFIWARRKAQQTQRPPADATAATVHLARPGRDRNLGKTEYQGVDKRRGAQGTDRRRGTPEGKDQGEYDRQAQRDDGSKQDEGKDASKRGPWLVSTLSKRFCI